MATIVYCDLCNEKVGQEDICYGVNVQIGGDPRRSFDACEDCREKLNKFIDKMILIGGALDD